MIAREQHTSAEQDEDGIRTWQDVEELRWAARHWAVQIGVRVPHIHIRPMTTKWASMSTAGRLTLDAGLVNVPKELGEFVIVHELIHILAPNHGKLFKSFMYAYMPDWEVRERRLRSYVGLATCKRQNVTHLPAK